MSLLLLLSLFRIQVETKKYELNTIYVHSPVLKNTDYPGLLPLGTRHNTGKAYGVFALPTICMERGAFVNMWLEHNAYP